MAHLRPKRYVFILLVALSLLIACAYFLFPVPALIIVNLDGERAEIRAMVRVSDGSGFTIRYIHSVDRLPVYESFFVDHDHRLLLSETRFLMLGAGMSDSEGELGFDGQWTIIRNINREVSPFHLRVSSIAEQTLLVNGRVIKLNDIAPESGLLKFEVRRISIARLILAGGN